ncbi:MULTISPECIES: ABC transporter ATP-binding protein [Micromonospora]|uniref:Sn-glycerol-3-phosphate ABC transporter ATP-binding protein UgpC n=1 Tax=Micromonospora solifontis TaxID=2487138 RepID=A0ABX9WBR2_9ACTN|nr:MULTISPECIES: sn-glycerol-3-phosphate ABC transporter ATP-binding protein UgpC [Micromonospora]NES14963.1 sn-glycerol-3-phosphate ABC transporter ATP-binding protein UgpC [Micromonospora sp. PPF5-17B]NES38553.1 sn-glycerol-3-phosphate ABC transporter ATP-binding protein UgpC [Micromonospora solifontis]NES58598.1 sn-glycerol-3-phosphate ABC transporter ATP-binding protein UgpC [Micromonospora sp. PPF5-6]RNL94575.1 sn-glycerol-3-phosphate ABC transporter ATP-binding protein UgpC [Micromonospor
MADIVLDKVSKRFPDGTMAVRDVDLEIADGEFVILVGPSGCGKSTTLNMIAGLEDISSGELRIAGERVNDRAPRDRDIAMVFQSYALYPNMTVRENMAFPLRLAKLDRETINSKVEEAAKVLELTPLLDRKPANLSGGQRQRVAMGRAIVRQPKAFLMDEPLSNLDAKLRVQMRTVVSRLQKQLGTTTVYVTHDQTEAMTLGDRVVIMRGGAVQQVGPPQELYDHPRNLFVAGFIGSPSMNFLPATVGDGRLRTALGDVPVGDRVRRQLEGGGDAPRELILGIRPEHFEDAALIDEETRRRGMEFEAPVEIVESMGSDKYVYLTVEGERATAAELEELAADAGAADFTGAGSNLVTRLSAESPVREGENRRVWFNLEKIHLFDPSTGHNLTLHEGRAAGALAD